MHLTAHIRCFIQLYCITLVLFLSVSCKFRNSNTRLYIVPDSTNIALRSSCKISAIHLDEEGARLKDQVKQSTSLSISALKIKQSKSPAKAGYIVRKTELIITERCGVSTPGNRPFTAVQEILTIEKQVTKEQLILRSDTMLIEKQKLDQPRAIVQQKLNIEQYIPALTHKNYEQFKKQINKK